MNRWGTAAALGAGVALGAAAARVRGRLAGRPVRPLHPDGRTFTAEVVVPGSGERRWGARFLDEPGRYRATVRFSKGAGTPPGWPDVIGLAIRVHAAGSPPPDAAGSPPPGAAGSPPPDAAGSPPPGATGEGLDADLDAFDLLLSTTGRPPALRHVPLPRRRFDAGYGSILSYRARGSRVYLAARPDPAGTPLGRTLESLVAAAERGHARLVLAAAAPTGRWRPFGSLVLGPPLPERVDERLAFDPSRRHPPDLLPVGFLQALRGAVYRGAQRVRTGGKTPSSIKDPHVDQGQMHVIGDQTTRIRP